MCIADLTTSCFNHSKSSLSNPPHDDVKQKTYILVNMTFLCSGFVVGYQYVGRTNGSTVFAGIWDVGVSTATLVVSIFSSYLDLLSPCYYYIKISQVGNYLKILQAQNLVSFI